MARCVPANQITVWDIVKVLFVSTLIGLALAWAIVSKL